MFSLFVCVFKNGFIFILKLFFPLNRRVFFLQRNPHSLHQKNQPKLMLFFVQDFTYLFIRLLLTLPAWFSFCLLLLNQFNVLCPFRDKDGDRNPRRLEGRGSLHLTLHCHHQNHFRIIKMGGDVSHFKVSLFVQSKSHIDRVHKPPFFLRERDRYIKKLLLFNAQSTAKVISGRLRERENVSRSGESNRGPPVYQPSALTARPRRLTFRPTLASSPIYYTFSLYGPSSPGHL